MKTFFYLKHYIKTGINTISINKSNLSKLATGISFIIGSYIYYKNENFRKWSKNLHCLDLNPSLNNSEFQQKDNYYLFNNSKIRVYYDENNLLQREMAESIFDLLTQNFSDKKINIEKIKIDANSSENKIPYSTKELINKNEPLIIVENDLCLEFINPYSFFDKNDKSVLTDKTLTKLNNLLTYRNIKSMKELREEFRSLDNPTNRIIIISPSNAKDKSISLFRNKRTKILLINDEKLREILSMQTNYIYQYYSSKIPFKMKDTESFLQGENYTDTSTVDLNSYMNSNPVSLMLKFKMFRDEIKLSDELCNKENINEINNGLQLTDRIKLQKLICYPRRNVSKLAEVDKKLILTQLETISNRHNLTLLIYVPSWGLLKENIFDYLLFESSHLFDKINITTSKNFLVKKELYDNSEISGDIPQIYLIETGLGTATSPDNKKVYNMNYFRFPDDFSKYLKNKKEPFKKPESIENLSFVKTINSGNFDNLVINDKSFNEFLIEIKHEGCPTCYMLGKMFDHLSQKFKKHKLDKKIKFFRIDTSNDIPCLGEFSATPTYLFCRKNQNGEITFISHIDKKEFLFKIKKLSKYDLNKVRYHPNIGFGFYLFQRNEFLKPAYDPDIDLSGFSIV